MVGVATSAGGMRLQAATSAEDMRSQTGTSIRASIDNLVDSGAAPYSASAAFFLATTLVMVSVSVIRATTLLGIARSTLTAITLPWDATIRIRIPVRRINKGRFGIGDPIKSMSEPNTERAVVDCATNVEQIGPISRPSHLLLVWTLGNRVGARNTHSAAVGALSLGGIWEVPDGALRQQADFRSFVPRTDLTRWPLLPTTTVRGSPDGVHRLDRVTFKSPDAPRSGTSRPLPGAKWPGVGVVCARGIVKDRSARQQELCARFRAIPSPPDRTSVGEGGKPRASRRPGPGPSHRLGRARW
jgi:hypothetical protein